MLKSKCILSEKDKRDGERISIMSRHTLNDGITPDIRITEKIYDEHLPELGPPSKLVGMYYRNEITFDEYRKQYLQYLDSIKEKIILILVQPALASNVTVMCIEEEPDLCHRKILVEYSEYIGRILLGKNVQILLA